MGALKIYLEQIDFAICVNVIGDEYHYIFFMSLLSEDRLKFECPTFALATIAPMINANVKPNPNPNPKPNLNPYYPTPNQKPNHHPNSNSLLSEISSPEQLSPE